jgi:hypothetical protein
VCNDQDACTEGDVCGLGACKGKTIDCDDGNPCTADTCSAFSGCSHPAKSGNCDDGSACTVNDSCSNSV